MTNRLVLIPGYQAALRRERVASQAHSEALAAKRFVEDQLSKASIAEAADQVGRVLVWSTGKRAKIIGLNTHWCNAALVYPVVSFELTKKDTWAKRGSHLHGHVFNFELGVWEIGRVDLDSGDFTPETSRPSVAMEKVNG